MPVRMVVLISGSGTTLQNFLDRIDDARLNATIVGVVSSRPDTLGVQRAQHAALPTRVIERKGNPAFSEQIFQAIREWNPDIVCLAGWLHLIRIPADFHHRVLNIHPSLLPAFGGKGMFGHHVHEAVLTSGARVSGCTVHFADDTYDTGPIILQKVVEVQDADTPDSLAARVFAAECEAYPEAITKLTTQKWSVQGRRVTFKPANGIVSDPARKATHGQET